MHHAATGSTRLPAAAVFDWDGTLVDTLSMILRANRGVIRRFGLRVTPAQLRSAYSPDWRQMYRDMGIEERDWPEASRLWEQGMIGGRPRALPYARGALRRLRARGVRLGVVTASSRAIVLPNLARLNLDGVFDALVCDDDVTRSKPHPEGLLRALGDLGVAPADAVYVGDTPVDRAAAAGAGVAFVAVGGTVDDAAFAALGVDHVWPSVGAWADDLLGPGRSDPGLGPVGRAPADGPPVRSPG